jgi:hypothetical protein
VVAADVLALVVLAGYLVVVSGVFAACADTSSSSAASSPPAPVIVDGNRCRLMDSGVVS